MKIITYWTLFVLSLFFWSSVYSMNHSEDIFFVRHGHSYKGSIIAYNENLNTIRHECNKNHYRIGMVTFEQSQGNKTKGFIKNLFILEKYKDYNLAPDLIVT